MEKYFFNGRGRHAPAYGCSHPGDNTGEYVRMEDLAGYIENRIADIETNFPDDLPDLFLGMVTALKDLIDAI